MAHSKWAFGARRLIGADYMWGFPDYKLSRGTLKPYKPLIYHEKTLCKKLYNKFLNLYDFAGNVFIGIFHKLNIIKEYFYGKNKTYKRPFFFEKWREFA